MSVIDPAPTFAVPNARELRWPVMFGDEQQRLHRGLPFVLCPGQLGNVLRGIAERDQQFPARQYDRIEKSLIP